MRSLFLILFSLSCLNAEEPPEISLVDQIESPVLRVVGSVNVISGNLVDQGVHSESVGPDPYVVAHSYVSIGEDQGNLADGWDFYHPSELHVSQPRGLSCLKASVTMKSLDNEATLYYRDAGGATIVFKGDNKAKHFSPRIKKTGYAFTSSIETPCRRDIKKTSIWWESHSDRWMVRLSDGTLRKYKPVTKFLFRPQYGDPNYTHKAYRIEEERFPSGNMRKYFYNSDHDLQEIRTLSSKGRLIHNIQFYWHEDHVAVKTSEDRWVKFFFHKLSHRNDSYRIREISRPGKPTLSYFYEKDKEKRVEEKKTSGGFYEKVNYYPDNDGNFFKNRVHALYTKLFKGDKPFRSHAFKYREWEEHTRTRVKEPDGAYKSYMWDKQKRPIWVSFFTKEGKLLQAEHFIWGEGDDEGRLKSRVFYDEEKRPLVAKEYVYDKEGNVVREKLRGTFTGQVFNPLVCGKDKEPYGGELIQKSAAYNERGLKTEETDPFGNKTYFSYEKNRDLLTARLTCEGDKIIKREFFSYDEAGIQIEIIVDDGDSRDKKKLSSVTKRLIKRIHPRTKTPRYGEPDEEKEYVWTPAGHEKLLQRRVFKRDSRGRLIRERLYDASNVLRKESEYEYDDCDRIIESKNTLLHRKEHFTYDEHGRLITKKAPESLKKFKYDLLNRVIEEKTTFEDGSSTSLCHQYDQSGRMETVVDGRGRTTTKVHDMASRLIKKISPSLCTGEGFKSGEELITYVGAVEKHTFPTGATTEIEKSGLGKPIVSINEYGAKTFYFYDLKGRLIEQQEPTGLRTLSEYDALDRPTRVSQFAAGVLLSEVSKVYRGSFLEKEIFPTKEVAYSYDAFGRKCSEVTLDLVTKETLTTEFTYDALHRLISTRQIESGVEERVSYDDADREVERKTFSLDGKLLAVTTKAYDKAGRIIEEGVGRLGTIAKTTTKWGAYGLVESITYPDGTKTRFSYTPLFRFSGGTFLQRVTTDPRGVVTEELLDSNDVAVATTIKDPFGRIVACKKVFQSLLGKPTLIVEDEVCGGVKKDSSSTRLAYDPAGQISACTYALGEEGEATWRYAYDICGRKIEEQKPSGVLLLSSYDEKSRLVTFKSSDGSISWKYAYNAQDLPEKIYNEVFGTESSRSYDGFGHLLKEFFESGLSLTYDLSPTGLFRSLTYPDGSKSLYTSDAGRIKSIERFGYTYRAEERDLSGCIIKAKLGTCGEVVQRVDIMGRRTLTSSPWFQEERTQFDPIGLCLERTIDHVPESFSYDALGQLTSDNGRLSSYDSLHHCIEHKGALRSHNRRHQLVRRGDFLYEYDQDGRRIRDGKFSYSYDALDRLIALEGETVRYEYAYDSFHRRILEKRFTREQEGWKEAFAQRFLWQGECEIGSFDKDDKPLSLRVLGEGIGNDAGASVLFELSGTPYIPLHDLSGHVRALVSLSGESAEKISYTAFGVDSRTGPLSPWTFSSKREDGTGFIYFGRRFYDPEAIVWLTQDPLGHHSGPNLFAYVKNNPLSLFDSVGLAEEMTSADRGVFGTLWQSVASFFDGLFGSHETSATPQNTSDRPPQESTGNASPVMIYRLHDGTTVYASRDYRDQIIVHRWGQDFFKEFEGRDLKNGVLFYLNGMNQSLFQCYGIAEQVINENPELHAIVLLYNSTKGYGPDIAEACANLLSFSTKVVNTLRSELNEFNNQCFAHSIKYNGIFVHWSQGAAIAASLWSFPEFKQDGRFHDYMGAKANFGGAALSRDGPNYVAQGDLVPYLFPGNAHILANPREQGYDVRFIERQSSGCTHEFMGPEYHGALNEFLREQLGG